VSATVTPLDDNRMHIRFDASLRDITAGQGAILYDGEVCLGGGIIERKIATSSVTQAAAESALLPG
jgi:tRNA-specific 2-thiouridylase